jgi:hypothetical protein
LIPGQYTITATFAGDDSYGSSRADTFATLTLPTATATATVAPLNLATTSDLMSYIVVGVIAMIIAVAIATVLILRKHA